MEVTESTRNRSSHGALIANIQALAVLVLGERSRGWYIALGLLGQAGAELVILHSLGEAVASYRAGHVPAREMWLFLAGVAVNIALSAWLATQSARTVTQTVQRLLMRLIRCLSTTRLEHLNRLGMDKIRAVMTRDAARVLEIGTHFVWFMSEALFAFIGLLYFSIYSAQAAFISLIVLVGAAALVVRAGLRVERHSQTVVDRRAELQTLTDAVVAGFAQVKVHRPRSDDIAEHFADEVAAHADEQGAYYRSFYDNRALAETLLFALIGTVVFVYVHLFPDVREDVDRLVITGVAIFEPVTMIFLDQLEVARGGEAVRRIRALIDQLEQPVSDVGATAADSGNGSLPASFSHIGLRGVRYAHPARTDGSHFAIGPIDLDLRPGELIFVTGANGSGKSTFLRVLTGLYARHAGQIEVDGEPVPESVPERIREQCTVIFSEFVLFKRLYGFDAVAPERVDALLRTMQLSHRVTFSDGRFSTTELSTGQRKRLAMVVALLRDRPIYVFDEWAADQDPVFRATFYEHLLPELVARGKCVVAVTHDDDYFALADRHLHFVDGCVVELESPS